MCELLASHIPDDEAMLLKNGRLDLLLFGDKHRLSSDFAGYLSDASVLSRLDACNNRATTSLSGTTQYLIWEVFFVVSQSIGAFTEVFLHNQSALARNLKFVFPLKCSVCCAFLSADLLLPSRLHICC